MIALLTLCLFVQTGEREIDVNGTKRTYILHVGKDAKGPMPLVIQIHGMGATGRLQQGLTGMNALADKHGFAVAYPNGQANMWRVRGSQDVDFMKALIDAHVKDGTADPRRVYASGMSNGSIMSMILAIELADRIAAIGCVGATLPKTAVERAKPSRAVPVLYMHGTSDSICGYDGAFRGAKTPFMLPAEEMMRWWAKSNDCAEKERVESLPDSEEDGTTVQRWTFEGAAPVVFYRIEGGGHTWAGGPKAQEAMLGRVSRDFNASEVIWEFLSKHALPEK